MSWDAALAASTNANASSLYVKLEPGETLTLVFLGDPVVYADDYQGRVSTKLLFPIWDCSAESVRVLDINAAHPLKDGENWYAELDNTGTDYRYELRRVGSGPQTRYRLRPLRNGELGELANILPTLELPDLDQIKARKEGTTTTDDGIPF